MKMTDKDVIRILSQMCIIEGSSIYDDKYDCLDLTKEQRDYISTVIVSVALDVIKDEITKLFDIKVGE